MTRLAADGSRIAICPSSHAQEVKPKYPNDTDQQCPQQSVDLGVCGRGWEPCQHARTWAMERMAWRAMSAFTSDTYSASSATISLVLASLATKASSSILMCFTQVGSLNLRANKEMMEKQRFALNKRGHEPGSKQRQRRADPAITCSRTA